MADLRLRIVRGLREREAREVLASYDGVTLDNVDGKLGLTIDGRRFEVTSDFVQDAESLEGFIEAVRQGVI